MGGPALIDAQADGLLSRHNAMMATLSCLAIGGIVTDGGTTQASGASGTLNLDIDTSAVVQGLIDGVVHTLAAATDADAAAGTPVVWGATSGVELQAAVVLTAGAGNDTPAIEVVLGAVAATGASAPPTADAIDTALTHANWALLANVKIVRTGDTTVTFVADNAARYGVGVTGAYRKSLAVTEAAFRESSPTQP